MSPRPSLCAIGVIALASAPVLGQFVAPRYSVGRIGSHNHVRPPIHTVGYGAFNPNFVAPAFASGFGYGYFANDTGLRPSYWSLPGRYNAYPWSGAGVYTGGTAVNAFYAPWLWWGGNLDYAGLSGPYDSGYFGDGDGGHLYLADAYVGAYRNALPANAASIAPANRAMLSVQAPSDAKIWLQDKETTSSGSERVFTSPPLKAGQDYSYTVKAQWKVSGKSVEQTQTVTVRAGERAGLLFLSGNEVAAAGR